MRLESLELDSLETGDFLFFAISFFTFPSFFSLSDDILLRSNMLDD